MEPQGRTIDSPFRTRRQSKTLTGFPANEELIELLARRRICVDPQGYSKVSQLSQYLRRELRAAIKAGGKVTAPNVNVVAFPVFLKHFGNWLERPQKRGKSGF